MVTASGSLPPDRAAVSGATELLAGLAASCDACERSWSIHRDGVEERVLFFFDHQPGRAMMLARAAVAMGFPADLLAGWSQALPGADAIGLAVSRDLTSLRLYVQYWEALRERAAAGDFSPAPLYLGFKALGAGQLRTDAYICLPAAPRTLFLPPLRDALLDFGADADATDAALAPLTDTNAIHTEIMSQTRRSWLTTVRRAPLDPALVARALSPVADRAGATGLAAALAGGADLVHLAGGEDEVKGRFLTVYLDSDPARAMELFTPPSP